MTQVLAPPKHHWTIAWRYYEYKSPVSDDWYPVPSQQMFDEMLEMNVTLRHKTERDVFSDRA